MQKIQSKVVYDGIMAALGSKDLSWFKALEEDDVKAEELIKRHASRSRSPSTSS